MKEIYRICRVCTKSLPMKEFRKWRRMCNDCNNRESNLKYWEHPEKFRRRSLDCYKANRTHRIEQHKRYEQGVKDEVFNAYGGYVCVCCGETRRIFLTLDHINGGGTNHRKKVGGGGT